MQEACISKLTRVHPVYVLGQRGGAEEGSASLAQTAGPGLDLANAALRGGSYRGRALDN